MNELTRALTAFAAERRVDLLGIAPIARFDDVPEAHHPRTIFPETASVIVLGKRIPRGALRGVEEGTQFDLYSMYGLHWLADRMLAITTIAVASWLEDHRQEAVPVQDLPPQVPPSGVPVAPGRPAPNVILDVRDAAVRASLGEYGYGGELLTPQFGPRQRFQLILTDALLDPTPLPAPAVCDACRACEQSCPLGAFSGRTRPVTVCGRTMAVAEIDDAACRRCRNGALPNPSHGAGLPDRIAAVCMRTCLDHLEQGGRVANRFENRFRKRPAWQVDAHGTATVAAAGKG